MMSAVVKESKKVLRKEVKDRLKTLSNESIAAQSDQIAHNLFQMEAFQQAQAVSVYLTMPQGEASTLPILQQLFQMQKKVYVPLVTGSQSSDMKMLRVYDIQEIDSFPKSKWMIPEPPETYQGGQREDALDSLDIDLVLLPGVGFDEKCQRLGHGRGYYDCFLQKIQEKYNSLNKPKPSTIGIAMGEQIVKEVPVTDHDHCIDAVVTPTTIYKRPL